MTAVAAALCELTERPVRWAGTGLILAARSIQLTVSTAVRRTAAVVTSASGSFNATPSTRISPADLTGATPTAADDTAHEGSIKIPSR